MTTLFPQELAQLNAWLADYESKYSMKSEEFWAQYNAGKMADTSDFMEWNALLKSRARLVDHLNRTTL
jgi:hypothetical protein